MPQFLGRIKQVSVKRTADLAKTTHVLIETEESVAGWLDNFPADVNVNVAITSE